MRPATAPAALLALFAGACAPSTLSPAQNVLAAVGRIDTPPAAAPGVARDLPLT